MKNCVRILVIGIFMSFFSAISYAQGPYVDLCDSCNEAQMDSMAYDWVQANVSRSEAQEGVRKEYHVIDTDNQSVKSYEVWKRPQNTHPVGYVYVPRIIEIETPLNIQEGAETLFTEFTNLSAAIQGFTIPEEVIENPWQLTGCAFCENDIADFIRSSGEINMTMQRIENGLIFLNLAGERITKTWVIPLEAGGSITIEIELVNGGDIASVKVVNVIDADNNNVPLQPSGLSGSLLIRVENQSHASINHYLVRFGFKTENDQDTTVTIEECRRPNDPPSTLPNCF